MATHSNILAWKITSVEEPGRLQSMGSQRDVTEHTLMHTVLCLSSQVLLFLLLCLAMTLLS